MAKIHRETLRNGDIATWTKTRYGVEVMITPKKTQKSVRTIRRAIRKQLDSKEVKR